jgi:hypothetical protein
MSMIDELLDRLRAFEIYDYPRDALLTITNARVKLGAQAARIEALEAALREISELGDVRLDEAGVIARAALGEKA